MSSTGKGRLYRVRRYGNLRGRVGLPDVEANARTLANDTFWGGYPPTPTQIPYSWLTPPARFRSDQPRNLAAVARAGGATARASSDSSIASVGERPFTATLNTQITADPLAYATWVVGNYTEPRQRMPQLRLNLMSRTPAECWRILEREIGDRISIIDGPPQNLAVAADAFGRTVSGGFGTADSGGVWNATDNASDQSVSGGVAHQSAAVRTTIYRSVLPVGVRDVFVRVTSLVNVAPLTEYIRSEVVVRYQGANDFVVLRVHRSPGGANDLQFVQLVGGVETVLAGATSPITHVAGLSLFVRVEAVGSVLRATVWRDGTSEPVGWDITATDPAPAAGGVGISSLLAPGNTNALPVDMIYDDFIADSPNPHAWPDGVTDLVIEGIAHSIAVDTRWVIWNTAPVIGATAGEAGPWFRADESRTDTGSDLLAF